MPSTRFGTRSNVIRLADASDNQRIVAEFVRIQTLLPALIRNLTIPATGFHPLQSDTAEEKRQGDSWNSLSVGKTRWIRGKC